MQCTKRYERVSMQLVIERPARDCCLVVSTDETILSPRTLAAVDESEKAAGKTVN